MVVLVVVVVVQARVVIVVVVVVMLVVAVVVPSCSTETSSEATGSRVRREGILKRAKSSGLSAKFEANFSHSGPLALA